MEQFFTIKEIAEKNGCSAKTIQNTIKSNPQLGIVMQPRKKTLLTYDQAAKISGLLDKKRTQFSGNSQENPEILSFSQNSENVEKAENTQFEVSANENSEVAELRKQILQLIERAAKAEGEAEALKAQVEDLKGQRDKWDGERINLQGQLAGINRQLQTAEENAARAQAEADSYEKSVFGFYRKK